MRRYIARTPPENEDDEDAPIPLPYRFDLCVDLWIAWDRHGIMPLPGGYLQQPRAWRAMIHVFNQRHNRADRETAEETDYQSLLGEDGAPGAEGWDAFKGTGG